jgi:site-specific recombinase XerD
MTAEGYHLAAAVKSVKGSTIPAGRELQSGELAALMISCENDNSPAGVRDAAIIALMYSCGLRREEVTTLNINDYEPSKGKLIVKGKGSKERTAYLTNGALDAITDWLQVRGNDPGGMFVSINKSGKLNTERFLTPQAIYNLLIKRASQASVKEFSPHDLRRTFVSDLLDAGADIATVAKMAGHASVNTTARYDRRPEEAKKKAAGLLHIPYIKR